MVSGGVFNIWKERVIKVRILKKLCRLDPYGRPAADHIFCSPSAPRSEMKHRHGEFDGSKPEWNERWVRQVIKCMMRMKYFGYVCPPSHRSHLEDDDIWYSIGMVYFWHLCSFFLQQWPDRVPKDPKDPKAPKHLPTDQDLRNFHHGSGQMWTCVGHPQRQARSTRQVHGSQMMAILMWKMNKHEIH